MEEIQISVVITVYNVDKYIGQCLDSIISQTGVKFEIICVNDLSPDNSLAILTEYAGRDDRIRIVNRRENGGLSSARNTGIRCAKGRYLYNIDGDDMLAPGALYKMFSICEENKLDMLSFSAGAFYDDDCSEDFGSEDQYERKHRYEGIRKGYELFCEMLKNGDRATSNRVLYCCRRDWFEENGLYDCEGLRYCDDSMFSMYMAAGRVMCIDDKLYLRRFRSGSAVTSPMKKRYLESMMVLFLHEINVWKKYRFEDSVNEIIRKYFLYRLKEIKAFYFMFKNDRSKMDYLKEHPAAEFLYKYFIESVPVYSSEFTVETIEKIKSCKNIMIYGAGNLGNEAALILESSGIYNYNVTVSSAGAEQLFRGRRVMSIDDIGFDDKDTVFIIAVSEKYHDEISRTLASKGYHNLIRFKGAWI